MVNMRYLRGNRVGCCPDPCSINLNQIGGVKVSTGDGNEVPHAGVGWLRNKPNLTKRRH